MRCIECKGPLRGRVRWRCLGRDAGDGEPLSIRNARRRTLKTSERDIDLRGCTKKVVDYPAVRGQGGKGPGTLSPSSPRPPSGESGGPGDNRQLLTTACSAINLAVQLLKTQIWGFCVLDACKKVRGGNDHPRPSNTPKHFATPPTLPEGRRKRNRLKKRRFAR